MAGDLDNLKVTTRADLRRAEGLYRALHPAPDLSALLAEDDEGDDEDEDDGDAFAEGDDEA